MSPGQRVPAFDELVLRADESVLQRLLGRAAVRLMAATQGRNFSVASIREALTQVRPPHRLLEDRAALEMFLDLLRPAELEAVAVHVGVQGTSSVDVARQIHSRPSALERLYGVLNIAVPVTVVRSNEEPTTEICEPQYRLFDHQRDALIQAMDRLRVAPHKVMLHMPTGSGKTRTAMQIAVRHLRELGDTTVVWLATSEELCDQAASEFVASWRYGGDRAVKLIRAWGPHQLSRADLTSREPKCVVAGLAKLHAARRVDQTLLPYLGDQVSLVIFDEAHHAIADTYRQVTDILVARNQDTRLLGLSATPGRTWNDVDADRELASYFGGNKVTLKVNGFANPVEYLVRHQYLARPQFRNIEYQGGVLSDSDRRAIMEALDVPDSVRQRLADDEVRNLAIIHEVRSMRLRHKRILVFAATVAHAELLAVALRGIGISAFAVTGSTHPMDRSRHLNWYRAESDEVRVLTNFGVLTTGFDAPQTSAALIARPTRSLVLFSQMAGRALRGPRAGGNSCAEIATVVDTSLPGFGDLAAAFTNWEDVW